MKRAVLGCAVLCSLTVVLQLPQQVAGVAAWGWTWRPSMCRRPSPLQRRPWPSAGPPQFMPHPADPHSAQGKRGTPPRRGERCRLVASARLRRAVASAAPAPPHGVAPHLPDEDMKIPAKLGQLVYSGDAQSCSEGRRQGVQRRSIDQCREPHALRCVSVHSSDVSHINMSVRTHEGFATALQITTHAQVPEIGIGLHGNCTGIVVAYRMAVGGGSLVARWGKMGGAGECR